MAAGLPVVATDVGGNREIINDQNFGYLVPTGDHQALAERIIELLSDQLKCISMGAEARKYVEQHFSWFAKIKEMESYYLRLFKNS